MSVIVYGSEICHKTQYYISFLTDKNVKLTFKDVVKNNNYATELIELYETRKLNFR